ncbi:L-histidine N(alpha)-methyltransferase [Streptomyces sp. B6B3]|uniref:L-histidine N(alpha)-methyltransferase n=1 Tax=Streptomyces sp. B6B3 TaxID=3153570 RepID=UPI00325F1F80
MSGHCSHRFAPRDRHLPTHPPGAVTGRRPGRDRPRFTLDRRLPEGALAASLRADVRAGLTTRPKTLPPKWFYDAQGSRLFDRITRLPEYYPTRVERRLLAAHAAETARLSRARTLVELGSGSSEKTRVLLDALLHAGTLERYAPLDVSPSALTEAGRALCREYPRLRVQATVTDLESDLALPDGDGPRLVAFLGSTLGNLTAPQRDAFYAALRRSLTAGDTLLIGVDLVKEPAVLLRAYDDAEGVTAEFNRNVLRVMNRELGADFAPDAYEHRAVWDDHEERIEMRLRSRTAQTVKFPSLDLSVDFAAGEELRTEISVKFRQERLTAELARAGLTVRRWWTDRPAHRSLPDRGSAHQAPRFALLLVVPTL